MTTINKIATREIKEEFHKYGAGAFEFTDANPESFGAVAYAAWCKRVIANHQSNQRQGY